MRPELTKDLAPSTFRNFYWLGEELIDFCRENNLSTVGPKVEIANRIEVFLTTGEMQLPVKRKARKKEPEVELTLDTVITENHRCSQHVRVFFKEAIPGFHFSTHIQNYFRENVGSTYREAVAEWYAEEERKKDPSYKTNIGSQFEFNQFTRDFFSDPANKGRTRKDATKEWMIVKSLPGDNKYRSKEI